MFDTTNSLLLHFHFSVGLLSMPGMQDGCYNSDIPNLKKLHMAPSNHMCLLPYTHTPEGTEG